MHRIICAFVFILLSAVAARADERTKLDVHITPSTTGVTAHFELAREVTSLRLEYRSELAADTWTIATPGLTYQNGGIHGSQPFRSIDVTVAARNEPSGPFYPCVMKIGEVGRIIFVSYFTGDQETYETTLHFEAPESSVVLGLPNGSPLLKVDRTYFGIEGAMRYVYIGPKALTRAGKFADYIVGSETQDWTQSDVERLANKFLPYYSRRTGVPLQRRPLFLITTEPSNDPKPAFQGDVTDGPNVALRFFGDWSKRDDKAQTSLTHFIAHETAHFWNGHLFHSREHIRGPWLHEGGAEYWSYIASRELRLPPVSDPVTALNDCIDLLGPKGLGRAHAKPAYDCGNILQWFADLGERKQGRDIFALWREMFSDAQSNGTFYSAEMFKEHARRTPAVFEAFLLVFEPGDVARWNKLPAILATLGTKLEIAPYPPDKMRNAIVLHLLKLACAPGLISKNNYTDHFRLNTDDRCGSLASNPEVDSVNGHNLFTDTQAAFASVTKDCEAGAEVTLSRSGQADVRTMSCTKPLQQPPTFKLAGP